MVQFRTRKELHSGRGGCFDTGHDDVPPLPLELGPGVFGIADECRGDRQLGVLNEVSGLGQSRRIVVDEENSHLLFQGWPSSIFDAHPAELREFRPIRRRLRSTLGASSRADR
jgi:hypothetical protein